MARWDWYQATVHGLDVDAVVGALQRHHDLADVVPDRGKNGYTHGAAIRRGDRTLARVWWGGNKGVHVIGTGEDAPAVREVLEGLPTVHPHQPTRVDACEDWRGDPALFDRLSAALIGYARENRISINQQGDWVRGEARTLYLGSKHSVARLVLYEKGYEQGPGADLTWVRLEVRVRPAGWARDMVARWTPGEAFGASQWLLEALACIGWGHLQKQACGTVWRAPDDYRARCALTRQYMATIRRWVEEAGGWDAFGEEMAALADDLDRSELTVHDVVSADALSEVAARELEAAPAGSPAEQLHGRVRPAQLRLFDQQGVQDGPESPEDAAGSGDREADGEERPVRGQAARGRPRPGVGVGARGPQGGPARACPADARRGAVSGGEEPQAARRGRGLSSGLGGCGAPEASGGEPLQPGAARPLAPGVARLLAGCRVGLPPSSGGT